ncbi:Uncharacterised protein [Legionella lansingensis]|uniref:Dot/Icm T4SS effector n=1 Tax=Legionella lansingensis TaxID=45067 RepID=A0A0W0VG97_9GAMM|nr:hypothetical protein [Legionella lansingensis]KTD18806.1 hypothetical protein Llan_2409 [Legionella lansingensis]SNV43246.1 Uncharacterised protein [Legionella lansingensis]
MKERKERKNTTNTFGIRRGIVAEGKEALIRLNFNGLGKSNNQIPQAVDEKYSIRQGIVTESKEELIRLKFNGLGIPKNHDSISLPHDEKKDNRLQHNSPEPKRITQIKKEESASTRAKTPDLIHLTKSRPKIPARRKPTRRGTTFFDSATEKSLELSESTIHLDDLKQAILAAEKKYHEYYQLGTESRQPNGWFSRFWFRHGSVGQEKAGAFLDNITLKSSSALLTKLGAFLNHSETRYNNHSFASYTLDELCTLLQVKRRKQYDVAFANQILTKLNQLIRDEPVADTIEKGRENILLTQ